MERFRGTKYHQQSAKAKPQTGTPVSLGEDRAPAPPFPIDIEKKTQAEACGYQT
ncbi:MAG: hypothetical protein ACLP7A_15240 [Desulfobaccales bacterium]